MKLCPTCAGCGLCEVGEHEYTCRTCNGHGRVFEDGDDFKHHPHEKGDGSWWEHDAQGIPLARVCSKCIDAKLSVYRPEILTGYDQSDVDEPIEPDVWFPELEK